MVMAQRRGSKTTQAAAEKANPVGRPTDYRPEYNDLARRYALLSATDEQIANLFGVSQQTLNAWKNKHPKFLEALKEGKDEADSKVAESLYNRAMGYKCPETKAQWVQDDQGGRWEYATLEKQYPPDTQAASLWLRNRQSAKWRDKTEAALTGVDGGPLVVEVVKFGKGTDTE